VVTGVVQISSNSAIGTQNHENSEKGSTFRDRIVQILKMDSGILEAHRGDLDQMLKTGKIRVLTTYSYGNYFIHEGQTHGFEYAMMEEYKKYLSRNRSRRLVPLQFYYIPVPYHLLIPALEKGYGDIVAANLTILPQREKEVKFTNPYLWNLRELVITRRGMKKIDKLEDLAGTKIHVREESSYFYNVKKINNQFKARSLQPIIIKTLSGFLNTGEIIEMVNAGIIERTIADSHIADMAEKLLPGIKVQREAVLKEEVKLGWLVRHNNPMLKQSLNGFINTIKKGTLKGNIFFNRYFKKNPWVRQALSRGDMDRFSRYALLFKKYGDRYNLDWILLAAQAFQESGFDPDARSHMGAVGLMQLLPATAADMGIKQINDPEKNIHAGVKYMRWLIDHYFKDDSITSDNQLRFALAAYNAGPGNIIKSRKRAQKLGYDSNRWFSHTEMGTLSAVGLEPVHYVRNINRYYLSFLLSKTVMEMKGQIIRNNK
jgi:membrane-bound lytic murein transglycosylase MltF